MDNWYLPRNAAIHNIRKYNPEMRLYTLRFVDGNGFEFTPGQFVLLSLLGFEEAAFGIASSPMDREFLEVCIREVGGLTEALAGLEIGDEVGVRGPFGNGFPLEKLEGGNVVLAAGGTGVAPIASLVEYLIANREKHKDVYLLYGAKTPGDLLFSDRFRNWSESIEVCLTVEEPDRKWKGGTGLITDLCKATDFASAGTGVVMCGPPVMYRFMVQELTGRGITGDYIYISMERRMRCGIGKCQHCAFGKEYVCLDGPVFNYADVSGIPEEG